MGVQTKVIPNKEISKGKYEKRARDLAEEIADELAPLYDQPLSIVEYNRWGEKPRYDIVEASWRQNKLIRLLCDPPPEQTVFKMQRLYEGDKKMKAWAADTRVKDIVQSHLEKYCEELGVEMLSIDLNM